VADNNGSSFRYDNSSLMLNILLFFQRNISFISLVYLTSCMPLGFLFPFHFWRVVHRCFFLLNCYKCSYGQVHDYILYFLRQLRHQGSAFSYFFPWLNDVVFWFFIFKTTFSHVTWLLFYNRRYLSKRYVPALEDLINITLIGVFESSSKQAIFFTEYLDG